MTNRLSERHRELAPVTRTELFRLFWSYPTQPVSLLTTPALMIVKRLPEPVMPTYNVSRLVQRAPDPVTAALLVLAVAANPMMPLVSVSVPPEPRTSK